MTNESSAVAALRELVAAHDDAGKLRRTPYPSAQWYERQQAEAYADERLGAAWDAARAALSAAPVSPPEPNAALDHPAGTGGNAHALSGLPADAPAVPQGPMEPRGPANDGVQRDDCGMIVAPAALAVQPLQPQQDQGAPASPSGSTLQPPAAASAAIPGATPSTDERDQ